jgi:hypothetical protein
MLTPIGFRLTINATEFANVEYFCTSVSLPSLSLNTVPIPYRNRQGVLSGDSIEYGNFSMTFVVDEEMKNYLEMFNWMERNAHQGMEAKDATLSILSNQNTSNKQVQFLEVLPSELGELEFNTQTTSVEYLTCTATLDYDRFKFVT